MCVCLLATPAHGGVLDWLSSVPFGGAAAGPGVSNVRQGDVQPSIDHSAAVPPIDPANPPMPAVDGSVLSDTFRTSPLRRGLFVQNDAKNGSEIMRVPFDAMFNYSTPYSPTVYDAQSAQRRRSDQRSGTNGAVRTLVTLSQACLCLCGFECCVFVICCFQSPPR